MYHLKKFAIPFFAVVLLIGASLACGSSDTVSPATSAATEPEQEQPSTATQPTNTPKPANTPEPTDTPEPTATPIPTDTPTPTNTPEPEYKDPVVLLELDGVGEIVSNNYELPHCWKSVLYWSVEASSYGSASLIVHLHNVQDAIEHTAVNEFAMDVSGISESVLTPLKGGEYYFSTENTDEAWSLRMECQDGVAPVGMGLDLQDSGNMVTDNYELHQCQKSVFVWSAESDSNGTASLIVHLCKDGVEDCIGLVNEFDMDLTESLAGETLQTLFGGSYFLVIENTSGRPWSIRWECRD